MNDLTHHGIKGQKWGVRRYQNKDGSLTAAGKKKYSKDYKKEAEQAAKEVIGNKKLSYLNIYNRAVDRMNNGEIDKFNKAQEKKHGKNFSKRDEYEEDYMKLFDSVFNKEYNTTLHNLYMSNKHYQKAVKLVEQYELTKYDDFARDTMKEMSELTDMVKSYKK